MPLPISAELFYGFDLTDEQKIYVDSIFDNQLTIVNAASGTGKTTLAVACAHILDKDLIYTFSPVEEGSMGHTPGSVEEKEFKYTQPLRDALNEIHIDPRLVMKSENNPPQLNEAAWVEAKSHTFLRGSNIKDCVLIIDEAANFTKGELKKVLTRVHSSTKVIMIGHHLQCDLKNPAKSGFIPYLEHFRNEPYAKVCELTHNFRGELARHADRLSW